MFIIRHTNPQDLDDIYVLAEKSGVGMTTLPADRDTLSARLERIQKTLQGQAEKRDQGYLFALEDTEQKKVVGISGIEVAIGLSDSFYSYHVGKQVHSSKSLGTHRIMDTLILGNDLTGTSELCTLFLDPDYRIQQNGKLLSKIRFLFIAAFQSYFDDTLIAEMRGYSDENGQSPFWNAVGSKFFDIDFAKADYLTGIGQKAFIAEMMPRFPIYVDLLPQEARDVIGKMHPNTQPAGRLLHTEGLHFLDYVDIFDAGPTLEAEICNLRAVNYSQLVEVMVTDSPAQQDNTYLCANDNYLDYRACLICSPIVDGKLALSQEQADSLKVTAGQKVRILSLEPEAHQ